MKRSLKYVSSLVFAVFIAVSCKQSATTEPVIPVQLTAENTEIDHLPSWNDTQAKKNIIAYVEDVTDRTSPNFIEVQERIATFDNDGCLWS